MAKVPDKQSAPSIEVEVPVELRRGVYANTINVGGTNSEVTLNFIFNNPTDNPSGTLVSRVIIPRTFVAKVAEILKEVEKQLKDKEAKSK